MRIRLLGGLAVHDEEGPLDLGPPRQRAVLALLALEAGALVPAERIIDLLWGEDAPKARSSLHAYISHLRRILDPSRTRGTDGVLVTQSPGYRLNVERADVDLFAFEDAVASARSRFAAGDLPAAEAGFAAALAAWTGPLLPELADQPFVVDAAARATRTRLIAVEGLAEARLGVGDAAGALAVVEPELAAEPLREHLHGLAALAMYRTGRQADALRVVDACRRALADVAGLEPGPELRRLEADLLAQAPTLDWRPAVRSSGGAVDGGAEPVRTPRPTPRARSFVGRDTELAVLVGALDDAEAGSGTVAVVSGEPGIGKTRLVDELVAVAVSRGIATASVRCPQRGVPPFWPVMALAEQLRAKGVDLEPLFRAEGAPETDLRGFDLHRAALAALQSVTRPVVLVIDDGQWADPDSLRLLEDVATGLAATSAMVVVTVRPLIADSPTALVDCLAELARAPGARHVHLAGLDADALTALVAERTGPRADDADIAEVVDVLLRRADGNALFAKELLDLFTVDGRIDREAMRGSRAIPPGVQFVVRRRVAQLPVPTQRLLPLAAVLGQSFDVAPLAAAAGEPEGAVLDALRPALDADLVADDAAGLRFTHALVADALAEEVDVARRAQVHAVAARWYADEAGPDLGPLAPRVAHHAVGGLLAGTGPLAISAATRAAEIAEASAADEDAAAYHATVAEVLARVRPTDTLARVDALVAQGRCLMRADQVEAAKEPLLAAIDLARATGAVDRMVAAAVLFNQGHVWTNEGYGVVDERVVDALDRTLVALGDEDLTARELILGARASELVFADRDRHRIACQEAVETARRAEDPATLARVLLNVELPNSPDDLDDRRARLLEVARLCDAHGLTWETTFATYHQLALVRAEGADLDGAEESLARARRALEGRSSGRYRSQLYWFESALLAVRGRYGEARRLVEQAYELHRRGRGYDAETLRFAGLAAIAVDVGGLEEVLADAADLPTSSAYGRTSAVSVAWMLVELGRLDDAERLLAIAASLGPARDDFTRLYGQCCELHALVELGRRDEAEALHHALAPFAGRWACSGTSTLSAGLVDLALARADALAGRTDDARRRFEIAAVTHARMRVPAWTARTLSHQGAFLIGTGDAGDRVAGTEALARAGAIADEYGLVHVQRRLTTS